MERIARRFDRIASFLLDLLPDRPPAGLPRDEVFSQRSRKRLASSGRRIRGTPLVNKSRLEDCQRAFTLFPRPCILPVFSCEKPTDWVSWPRWFSWRPRCAPGERDANTMSGTAVAPFRPNRTPGTTVKKGTRLPNRHDGRYGGLRGLMATAPGPGSDQGGSVGAPVWRLRNFSIVLGSPFGHGHSLELPQAADLPPTMQQRRVLE